MKRCNWAALSVFAAFLGVVAYILTEAAPLAGLPRRVDSLESRMTHLEQTLETIATDTATTKAQTTLILKQLENP